MKVINSIEAVRTAVKLAKQQQKVVGLVPTMGYLHEGHVALIKYCASMADIVIVSIFVNPTQFGENEDLDVYPRDLAGDCKKAEKAGASYVFAPEVDEIYPNDYLTNVSVNKITKKLCGQSRPGHFDGVTTVVSKLFNIIQPDIAVFGEKDFQQLCVIKRMVLDLNMSVDIYGHEIVRETDGLAMSSRNTYLDKNERKQALILSQCLQTAKKMISQQGETRSSQIVVALTDMINGQSMCEVDYVQIVHEDSLENVEKITGRSRLLLAVTINNKVRLIDNCRLLK